MAVTSYEYSKFLPDESLAKEAMYDYVWNVRTCLTIKFDKSEESTKVINLVANSKEKLPVKRLVPKGDVTYICQKSKSNYIDSAALKVTYDPANITVKEKLLIDDDIENADIKIEPSNYFIDRIKLLKIDQHLEVDTKFQIDITNPYESDKAMLFTTRSLKPIDESIKKPFDSNILLGSIDMGSHIYGIFTVKQENVGRNVQLYSFTRKEDNVLQIITYDASNVSPLDVLKMISNLSDENAALLKNVIATIKK